MASKAPHEARRESHLNRRENYLQMWQEFIRLDDGGFFTVWGRSAALTELTHLWSAMTEEERSTLRPSIAYAKKQAKHNALVAMLADKGEGLVAIQGDIEDIVLMVRRELATALERFPPMRSPHEGCAILLEEVDEMWDAIKRNDGPATRKEAVQVAAMAIRYLMDVGDGSNK